MLFGKPDAPRRIAAVPDAVEAAYAILVGFDVLGGRAGGRWP